MLQPNIKNVTPMENYKLIIEYDNGEKRMFDMSQYIKLPFYSKLADVVKFNTVHIVDNGWTLEWEDGQDISPHELYENSLKV